VTLHQSTSWTLIDAAARGSEAHRAAFVERYRPLLEAYFGARWRHSALQSEVEDAVQEVFLQCIRKDGVLARADQGRPGGFRAFFYGVARNVGLKFETKRRAGRLDSGEVDALASDEESLSKVFDRSWASMIVRQAADLMSEAAIGKDDAARKRVELLRLRFGDGLPIREIARRWQVDAKALHRQYARAREEFLAALKDVVGRHQPGTAGEVEVECGRLLALLH
jgi:RNA polymerase sigma-70 factor (ECF subfamily)